MQSVTHDPDQEMGVLSWHRVKKKLFVVKICLNSCIIINQSQMHPSEKITNQLTVREGVKYYFADFAVVATYMPKLTRSLHRCMHTSLHPYFIEDLKIPSAALLLQWNNLTASLQSLLGIFFKKKSTPRYYAASLQSLWEIFSEKITPRYYAASLQSLLGIFSEKNYPLLLRCFAAFPQNRSLDET